MSNGPVTVNTLSAYLDRHDLAAHCEKCGRMVTLRRSHFRGIPGDTPISEIRHRLFCQVCRRHPKRLIVGARVLTGLGRMSR